MDVEVLDFQINPCKVKVGFALIRYCEMHIRCDLVYFKKGHRVWMRMPERWLNNDTKLSYCFWPTREKSDEFQKEVLKLIFDKYDLDLEKVANIHKIAEIKQNISKNV